MTTAQNITKLQRTKRVNIIDLDHISIQTRKRYSLSELIAQCDPLIPVTIEEKEWLDSPAIGFEFYPQINPIR